jgi:hypothetical protein
MADAHALWGWDVIVAALLAISAPASSAVPPPVVVVDDQTQTMPVAAISWACKAATADGKQLSLTGDFPALSTDELKKGAGYHLNVDMHGTGNDGFTGSFPAALTFNLIGMNNYSILVGRPDSGSPSFILKFEFIRGNGFVNVLDAGGDAPRAYATGLCTSQVKP